MKKIKLFLAAAAAMVGIGANAITIDTDLTSSFNSLATTQWTGSSGQVGWAAPQVTTNSGLKVAAWERYNGSCDWTGDIMYTTVTGLAAGTYKIELYGAAAFTFGRGFGSEAFTGDFSKDTSDTYTENQSITENTGVTLYATTSEGTIEEEIPIWYATNFNTSGIATVVLNNVIVGSNGEIKIGLSKTSKSTNWHVVQLKGVTATVDADGLLANAVGRAKAIDQTQFSSTIAANLQSKIEAYENASFTTAQEYIDAIADIEAAIDAANVYIQATPVLTAMKELVDATNFYTTEAYNEYYGKWFTKYENGTLTTAEANALQNPNTVTGWHASITADNFLLSVWDVEPDFPEGAPYYINTWSTEGANDGSNFKVPFFEYYTGNENSLNERTLTATINNLEAGGVYSVEIWARVRERDGGSKTIESITMQVGAGKPVDLTAGSQIGSSQFYIDHFTALGKADAEGKLIVNINVAAESNISWLSFKNVKYTQVDLTDYENALAEAISAAEAIKDAKMNTDVASALTEAINTYKNASYDNVEDYQTAIDAVAAATQNANASIAVYQEIAEYNAAAAALQGDAAAAAYATTLTAYNEGTLTESAPAKAALIEAAKVAEPVSDITVVAPATWVGQSGTVASDFMKQAEYVGIAERYQAGAFTGDVMTQTIEGLNPGTYKVVLHGGASYTSGRGFEGATGQNHAYFFANDALKSLEVYDRTVIADGAVEEAILEAGVGEDGILKYGIQNITIGANWFVVDLESITYVSDQLPATEVTLAVSDAKWATFIAPFDVTLPSNVKAYTVDAVGEHNVLTMTEITAIAANTPVLLYSESPVNEVVSGVSKAEGMNYTEGLLTGVYGDLEITEGYVLQNQTEKGIGFYAVSTENAKTVPANHAYLTVPAAEVKFFALDDNATAIQGIMTSLQTGEIYDLSGRKVSRMQKGNVYIVNGKKVAVK